MAETDRPEVMVEVVAGTERVRVTGRAALSIAQVALHGERINQIPVGKLVAHFAHGQVKLELRESLPSLRLENR